MFRPTELIQKPILIAAVVSSKGRKTLISVKLLTKYVIIIYALASVSEKFGVSIKAVPKAKFSAVLGEKNSWAVPN